MREFQIITDTNSDLLPEYVAEKGIVLVPQYTILDGSTYEGAEGIDPADFYEMMKKGEKPLSQAINPMVTEEKFRTVLDAGKDILYLSFASSLSGSCGIAEFVAKELSEEYKDAKIYVVDTTAASLGEGLIVMKAIELQEQGKDIEAVKSWVVDNSRYMNLYFTVDDLNHLQRGGRVSKTSAIVGTIVGIKPLLRLDCEGKIVAAGKVRGRKKSLDELVSIMEKGITDKNRVAIMHGNATEDANKLADTIREKLGVKEVIINNINPSIGVHSGPGAIVIGFFGNSR